MCPKGVFWNNDHTIKCCHTATEIEQELFYHIIRTSKDPGKKKSHLKTLLRNGKNSGNLHFLLFTQCFLLFHKFKSLNHISFVVCK